MYGVQGEFFEKKWCFFGVFWGQDHGKNTPYEPNFGVSGTDSAAPVVAGGGAWYVEDRACVGLSYIVDPIGLACTHAEKKMYGRPKKCMGSIDFFLCMCASYSSGVNDI